MLESKGTTFPQTASTPKFEILTFWEELRVLKQIHLFGEIYEKKDFNLINAEMNLAE